MNISAKTVFQPRSYGNADLRHSNRSTTDAEVDYDDAGGGIWRKETHSFYGNPSAATSLPALPTDSPNWSDGMEYQTALADTSKTWQTIYNAWGQRPCVSGENCWFGDPQADTAPLHDPQLSWFTTTLDNNLVTQTSYYYDPYNNVTDEYDSDGVREPLAAGCGTFIRLTTVTM